MLELRDARATWVSGSAALQIPSLVARRGQLVLVEGTVGAGKSMLLTALAGFGAFVEAEQGGMDQESFACAFLPQVRAEALHPPPGVC